MGLVLQYNFWSFHFLPQIINEESTGCLSVDGSDIKWLLVNAIKELSAEIEELKKWKEEHTWAIKHTSR